MTDFETKEEIDEEYKLVLNKIFKQPIDYCKNTR